MRERFGEYYRPSSSEFDRLWDGALLVFDTNVLLNFYRISLGSRQALLAVLEQYRDRVWIPYQVGLEYHRNRLKVIDDQNAVYSKLAVAVDKATNEIKKATSEWPKERHPRFDVSEFVDLTEKSLQPIKDYIEASRPTEPRDIDSALRDDPILDTLTDIFSTAVGENYSPEDLERHRIEARRRFEEEVPPGYRDTSKGREQVLGDFLVWRQTLDHAKALDRPVILVTDERKEDWWRIVQNRVVGPRVELLQEFGEEVGRPFYMYSSDQFIRYASAYLKAPVNEGLVSELQDLSKPAFQERDDYSEDSDSLQQWRAIKREIRALRQERDAAESGAERRSIGHQMRLLSLRRTALEQFLMLSQDERLRLLQLLNDWHIARDELHTAKLAYDDDEISVGEMISREEEFAIVDDAIKQLAQVSDVSVLDALLRSRPEVLRQN